MLRMLISQPVDVHAIGDCVPVIIRVLKEVGNMASLLFRASKMATVWL